MGRAAGLLRSLVVPVALLLAWEGIARAGWVTPLILPSPSRVAVRWWAYLLPYEPFDPAAGSWLGWALSGELPQDALTSLMRIAGGFAIGAGLALPLGLVMGARPLAYQLLNPVLQLLRPIPPIAYIPLAILWFGLGNPPAFFLISLGAFFPVLMNTIAGVRSVDAIYLRAARNLGAGEWTLFRRVMVPAAMPYILTGVRVGIGVAFIVVIVAEMIAVNSGLGYRILEAREYFWSDKVIAGMVTIGLCGLGIDLAMSRLNGWLLRWHRGVEG
ncbi:MAG: ABC transporter permease [Anaeromyxobacter sp.]|nr:ABC transporter permease [Anaeromyxobacter sp.]MBL0275662.1 ABC transporter permease [Anaeromyxobacter sp.]